MSVEKKFYGYTADQKEISSYTLTNKSGMKAVLLDIGAVIESLLVPDKNGNLVDVVLGFGDPKLYLENNGSLGAVVGRHANRIANATYTLNGVTYKLEANNGPNNLHSNPGSYYKRLWDAKIGENSVAFTLHSPDGDQNYPGNFAVTVTYTLSDENGLSLKYDMESDKDTLANLTNHSYFNMDGHDSGDVLSQKVWIDADQFTPSDATLIPTGEYRDVTGTPFDFRTEKTIGQDINADDEQIKNGLRILPCCSPITGYFKKTVTTFAISCNLFCKIFHNISECCLKFFSVLILFCNHRILCHTITKYKAGIIR